MRLIQRTRNFPRDAPIDCTRWAEFVVVETTYRYFRITYMALEDDEQAGGGLQCQPPEASETE